MAWLQRYSKRNHSFNAKEASNTPRFEEPVVENNSSEPAQQLEPPGSWMYRRVRAVFEASHRATDRADGLLSPGSVAADEIIDQHEDENDSNQHEEETRSDMTDESLDVPDARQVSSDSETSNAPSDHTSNADRASGSIRMTDEITMSGIACKSRQVKSIRGTSELKQPPQGGEETPNKSQMLKESQERNSEFRKTIHDDPRAIPRIDIRSTSGCMLQISQNSSLGNDVVGKVERLLTKPKSPQKFQTSSKFTDEEPDSDTNLAVGRIQYSATRASASTSMRLSSEFEAMGRYVISNIESTVLPKLSTVFLKKLLEPTVTLACQEYISDGDKKPAAILPHPTEKNIEILESKMSKKRKRLPEKHTESRADVSGGLPLQIEFKASDPSRSPSRGKSPSHTRSSLAANSDTDNFTKPVDKRKKNRHRPLIYKTCRDKFLGTEVEDLQRTIPPKDESYFCTRKKRTFHVAVLSKESAMMMDQLGFGIPKDCYPNMGDIRKMIGEAVRAALHSTAKWEFFIPDSGAYIKKELESMISLHDYLDECGLGEHISVRIVSENGPAVLRLKRDFQRDKSSP